MVARADGVEAVRLSGVQSEGELAYGALQGLWSQLSEESIRRLPVPQQRALRIIFGLEAASKRMGATTYELDSSHVPMRPGHRRDPDCGQRRSRRESSLKRAAA